MRITAGTHKGRRLETPKGRDIRPTSDKIRAAIFNALNARGLLIDALVIDAFCGTGALGIEALSQGAAQCIFFDKAKSSIDLCKANIQNLDLVAQSKIILSDVTRVKSNEDRSADLIFLDPPYNQNLVMPAIENLKEKNWLNKNCLFVIETDKKEDIESDLITIETTKIYGDTKIMFARLL
jgi:16S rRNA (guanine966-N2)-methyltransferase